MDSIYKYLFAGISHKDWYETESKKLIELLPEFKGLPIIRCFAVTSMTTSIEANVHLAIKALKQIRDKQPFEGYLPNQQLYLELIKQGKDVPGRKIMNFIKALEGDPNAVVCDIWMCRAFGLLKDRILPNSRPYFRSPSKKDYDNVEVSVNYIARNINLEPRQVQSAIWAGIKIRESVVSKNVCWSDLLIKKKGFFQF